MRLLAVLPLLLLACEASAQSTDRFTLEKSGSGYVRMDRRTGEMSLCAERDGQLVCRLAADDRAALEREIEGMSEALERLEARIQALEKAPPSTVGDLPDEETVDRTIGLMERFLRSFMGIVREFEQDGPPDDGPAGQPQRT